MDDYWLITIKFKPNDKLLFWQGGITGWVDSANKATKYTVKPNIDDIFISYIRTKVQLIKGSMLAIL